MIRVHSQEDLGNLQHLENKKNILVRFVMDGCPWCVKTQPDWDNACRQARPLLTANDAIAEIESSFVENFKHTIRKDIPLEGFPTIIMIQGSKVIHHEARDTASIVKLLKRVKKSRKRTKKYKNKVY